MRGTLANRPRAERVPKLLPESGTVRGTFNSRILFGGLVGWFSRGINILCGFALIPVLFRRMSKEELGTWLLLSQSWAALGIFDLGFGVILTRRIAFAVSKLSRSVEDQSTGEAMAEIGDLVATGERIYRWVAIFGFACSFGVGAIYLRSLELREIPIGVVWGAWGVLCVSRALGVWAAVWTCLLQGAGYIGWDGALGSLVGSVSILGQIAWVCLGGGLVGLATVVAVGAIAQYWLVLRFMHWRSPKILALRGRWKADVFRSMLSPSLKAWLTVLGYLLLASTDQFFIAAYQGTSALPPYRAAFLLVLNLHLLAGVFSGASHTFVSQLWQAGDLEEIRAILRRNAQIGLLAMGCGGGAILALGPTLFETWLGPGNFVGYPVLGIFLATLILEHHANVFSTCGRASDDEAYAFTSIAGGVLKLVLASCMTAWLGLAGLALSTLIAQGLTNDWYMVYRAATRLRVPAAPHFREAVLPAIVVLVFTFMLGGLMNLLMSECRPAIRVGMVSFASAMVLLGSVWQTVIDGNLRNRILHKAILPAG